MQVAAGGRDQGYGVHIGSGSRHDLPELISGVKPARHWAVIADHTVAGLYGEEMLAALASGGVQSTLLDFEAGESSKNRQEWGRLTDDLMRLGFGRDCGVIGLGGGVTGDLAGFVAATFMRGIPVIQVPTSLLAMIDASVGGKTGVNTVAGKNLVGAFHAPALVVVDPEFTGTLSRETRAEGLAEAIKHGMIQDADYLGALVADAALLLAGDTVATERAVRRSVEIKAEVVSADEREAGKRKILNFGHTLGHGIEAASDYALPHGHAVAIGMVAEARMGERLGVTAMGTTERLCAVLSDFELPAQAPTGLDRARVVATMRADKKGVRGAPHWVPLAQVGQAGTMDGPLTLELDEAIALDAIFGAGEPTRSA